MKIAISSKEKDLDSKIDERFGRAKFFIIYDLDKNDFKVVENNQNLNAKQGAGIQAASNLAGEGVGAIITGNCGPKAFQTLNAAQIKIFLATNSTIKEAIEDYKNGKLSEQVNANVQGHW